MTSIMFSNDGQNPNRNNPTSTATELSSGRSYLRPSISADPSRKRNLKTIEISTGTTSCDIGGQGLMFDIRSKTKTAVRIKELTFYCLYTTDNFLMKIFTKRGTHRSFEENSTEWINIVDTVMTCEGPDITHVIDFSMFNLSMSDDLVLEANSTRAIYLHSENTLRYRWTSSEDAVYVEDSHVQILEGTGLSKEYGHTHSPRMWCGILAYEVILPESPPQHIGCEHNFSTPSTDSTQSYGHMFNIGSKYPGGIVINGLEFQTHSTTTVNYEIYTISTSFRNFFTTSNWNLIASGNITGAGVGIGTSIVGSRFTPVVIEANTSRGFYITLDTEDLRYASSPRLSMGDIFTQNDHLSIDVGISVANYPMGEHFYSPRQWSGRILYRTTMECPVSTQVQYIYEIHYPKDYLGDPFGELNEIVNSFVKNFLNTNSEVKSLQRKSGNSISLLSSETFNDQEISSCTSSYSSDLCSVLVTTIQLGYFSPSDTGVIKILLMRQNENLSDEVQSAFTATYVGDEPIDTETGLVLKGVGSPTMVPNEIAYLEDVIKSFLNKHISSLGVEILTVEIIIIDVQRLLIETDNLTNETSDISVQVVVVGIHRPPPYVNFDSIVEDAINFNTEELRNDLASDSQDSDSEDSGAEYFRKVQKVQLVAISNPTDPPLSALSFSPNEITSSRIFGNKDSSSNEISSAPSQTPAPHKDDSGSMFGSIFGSSIAIIIIAALATLGLVFLSYVIYKVVRKKRNKRTVKNQHSSSTLGTHADTHDSTQDDNNDKDDKDIVKLSTYRTDNEAIPVKSITL